MLTAGGPAPLFSLVNQDDEQQNLGALRGHPVLVYFYPRADTPGCTQQACALNEILDQVGETAVIGISPDAPRLQLKFAQKYSLGFPLLADEDHAVAEAFGVWQEKKNYGKSYMGILRSAFLIDEHGKIANAWYKISPKDTPKKLLEALV